MGRSGGGGRSPEDAEKDLQQLQMYNRRSLRGRVTHQQELRIIILQLAACCGLEEDLKGVPLIGKALLLCCTQRPRVAQDPSSFRVQTSVGLLVGCIVAVHWLQASELGMDWSH